MMGPEEKTIRRTWSELKKPGVSVSPDTGNPMVKYLSAILYFLHFYYVILSWQEPARFQERCHCPIIHYFM